MSTDKKGRKHVKQENVAKVEEITKKLSTAQSFVLIDYKGISVEQDTALRNEFRKAGVEYRVWKNRFLQIALNNMDLKHFDEALNGPTAIAMGHDDIAAPARIAIDKIGEFKKMEVKCGMVDGMYLDKAGCDALAKLPTREVLLSQLLGMLLSPITSLACVLDAIAKQKAE